MKVMVAMVLFSAWAVVGSGCSRSHVASDTAPPPPLPAVEGERIDFPAGAPQLGYLTAEAAEEETAVATMLNGRLAWDDDVTSRVTPPVSGRVVEILVNPGQLVVAGDVLARIRSAEFGQAQADARKARVDLDAAERALRRATELLAHGAAAQKDVDAAQAEHARAVSEVERTRATLALYGGSEGLVDGMFALRAPVSGVVVDRAVYPGQEVRADQVTDKPLFVISDWTRLWLLLDVTDADAASLKPSQDILVRTRAFPDKTFRGRIEVVGESLDSSTHTLKVRCAVDNSEKLLRAEMYVTADVIGTTAGVAVSTKAVFLKRDDHYVFVETAPGSFERRQVRLGVESNGRSEIVGGLVAGERVVTNGCLLLESLLES